MCKMFVVVLLKVPCILKETRRETLCRRWLVSTYYVCVVATTFLLPGFIRMAPMRFPHEPGLEQQAGDCNASQQLGLVLHGFDPTPFDVRRSFSGTTSLQGTGTYTSRPCDVMVDDWALRAFARWCLRWRMSPLTSLKEEVKTLRNLDGKEKAQDSSERTHFKPQCKAKGSIRTLYSSKCECQILCSQPSVSHLSLWFSRPQPQKLQLLS